VTSQSPIGVGLVGYNPGGPDLYPLSQRFSPSFSRALLAWTLQFCLASFISCWFSAHLNLHFVTV
jgi:hypothetical protein